MKRQTKFRGKSFDKWIFGDLVFIDKKPFIYLDEAQRNFVGKFFPVNPDSVGQMIGLKDIKSGEDIYEGDVLKVGENLICEIFFIENNVEDYGDEIHSAFHAKILKHNKIIPIDSYFKNNCVRLGNIFDNPELNQNS